MKTLVSESARSFQWAVRVRLLGCDSGRWTIDHSEIGKRGGKKMESGRVRTTPFCGDCILISIFTASPRSSVSPFVAVSPPAP